LGQTIAEKVFSRKAGRPVAVGDLVVVPVDFVMAQDTKTPIAIEIIQKAGLPVRIDRQRLAFVIDHRIPTTNELHANYHVLMRRLAQQENITLVDGGNGTGHILAPEMGKVLPGQIVVGTDSHSTTYGALNTVGVAIGSSELVALLTTGKLWFKVPRSMRINLSGRLQPGVFSKDVILHLVGLLGEAGANYHAVEYTGEAISHMSMDCPLHNQQHEHRHGRQGRHHGGRRGHQELAEGAHHGPLGSGIPGSGRHLRQEDRGRYIPSGAYGSCPPQG